MPQCDGQSHPNTENSSAEKSSAVDHRLGSTLALIISNISGVIPIISVKPGMSVVYNSTIRLWLVSSLPLFMSHCLNHIFYFSLGRGSGACVKMH